MAPAAEHPEHPDRAGAGRIALLFAIVALVYFAFNFLWTPNTPYPVVPDDFLILGGGVADMAWWWKRPVAANTIFLVGELGPAFAYFAISALAVVTAGMVLVFLGKVFALRWQWWSVLVFATLVSSHASAFEHSKYLGLLTNLTSHLFGLATLLLLWQAWRRGNAWRWLATCLLFVLSVFAKEDFILPPLLLLGYLWYTDLAARRGALATLPRWNGKLAASVALWVIAVGSLAWNAYDENPFIAGLFRPRPEAAPYAVDLGPGSIAAAAWTLFAGYVPIVSALAALAWLALWWHRPVFRVRLLYVAATIAALALPYALIPNNMPQFRAYAWLPWLAGVVVVALQAWSGSALASRSQSLSRLLPAVVGIGLAAAVAGWHHQERLALADRYRADEAVNRRMIASLERHRDVLRGQSVVGLRGLSGASPWCGNDAVYVNGKLGFRNRWLVFADDAAGCYRNWPPDRRRKRGIHVSVAPTAALCEFKDLVILDFAADGSARLRSSAELCPAAK